MIEFLTGGWTDGTHGMDDGGGAGLFEGLAAGVSVQTGGLVPSTPHTAILLVRRVTLATVRTPHRTVVQSHWKGQEEIVIETVRDSVT